jgi:hypothetical protein
MEETNPSEQLELEVTEEQGADAPETCKTDIDVVIIAKKRKDKTHFAFNVAGYDSALVERKLNEALKKTKKGLKNYETVLEPIYKELDDGNIIQGVAAIIEVPKAK